MVKINDDRCAPGIRYINGSCYSKPVLEDIAILVNERYNKNINPSILSKNELVKELDSFFKPKCKDQLCWVNNVKIDAMRRDEILRGTFRPHGPEGKTEWLSTTDINDVLEQYQSVHNNFLFLGAVPYDFEELTILNIHNIDFDELINDGKTIVAMVINLDEHYKSGSHWVAVYTNLLKNQIYFFDSVGKPPRKRIKKFINKITKYLFQKKYNTKLSISDIKGGKSDLKNSDVFNKLSKLDIKYNHIQHQFKNSECGVYSTNFIIRLLEGEKFNNIIDNITLDDKMNKYRNKIFINTNI